MMSPDVVKVLPQENYELLIWFDNGEIKKFDMKPYIEKGQIFRELKEKNLFFTAKPVLGTVQWSNEADLCPDTFYLDSVPFENGVYDYTELRKDNLFVDISLDDILNETAKYEKKHLASSI